MAVSRIQTGLSIDEWAQIIGISPWDINQFRYPGTKSAQCQDVIFQYAWQRDHLSREEIGQAIANAERMVADELLYWPAPHYEVDEPIMYPRPHQRELFGYAGTSRGEWKTFNSRWHKFIKGGVLNRTLIGAISGDALVPSDRDGDGINETFTATITDSSISTITDWSEITLYFQSADRHGEPIDETWRIRPIQVSVSGNTATITGSYPTLAKPTPQWGVNAAELDAKVSANYVSAVDCYHTFTDTTSTAPQNYQGVAMWKTIPGCTSGCEFAINPLCLGDSFNEQGQILADFGNPCTWPFQDREPDRLSVNYVSGMPLVNGRMERNMAQIVAILATALLANDKCGCDRTNRIIAKYRQPVLKFQDKSADAQSFAESANTFPMNYGGQWAYDRIRQARHIEAVGI